jgi:hypothetical protein
VGFYEGLRDGVALNLLTKYGFATQILVKLDEAYDPVTGKVTTPTTWEPNDCKAVFGDSKKIMENGVLAKQRAHTVYVDASILTTDIDTACRFIDADGSQLEILEADPIDPGGVRVIWKLTVKK